MSKHGNELRIIDEMLKERLISFKTASLCWQMIHRGMTATSALKRLHRQKKDRRSLEVLVDELAKKARRIFPHDCNETPRWDALSHIDEKASAALNSQRTSPDDDIKEMLIDNGADSLGMWS